MVLLLTAIILSGFANRFAPNYPAFLIGTSPYGLFENIFERLISRCFPLRVHVPRIWDSHVRLDDGTLRW